MHQRFPRTLLALATAVAITPALGQDSAATKALEQKLDASLRAVQALQKRVEQLERKDAPAAAPEAMGARVDAVERTLAQLEAATAAGSQADTGLPMHGFVDLGGGVRNKAAASSAPRGFSLGTLDLYMTPQISSQVKGLMEVIFEWGQDGGVAVDVERLQLGYVFSDALTLWAGRFHTPYGYWNTAFHHGAQIQTALSRPKFLEFEDKGGILPSHSVGLWGTGALNTGLGKLGYDVYLFNGNRIGAGVLDFQASGDEDGSLGLGFRSSLALGGSGWTVGLHGMRQRVGGENADASASGRSRLNMLGAYAAFDNDDWEAMGEFYRFSNQVQLGGTGTRNSNAWYAQLGRNLGAQFTPYARVERTALDAGDPYFALQDNGKSYRRVVAGLRYNVSPKSALKAEWMQTTEDGTAAKQGIAAVQYSVRF